ncbi:MAG: histidine phosphatase family protein [Bacilli bacterium]|nr:histidine phosphatase family protein [Bacilli bacterium]
METIIYLIRHSKPLKDEIISDNLPTYGVKNALSVEGEKRAESLSKWPEFKDIDLIISSNYVRAISTAKYIAYDNDTPIHINENFGERKHGILKWSDLPENFEQRQKEEPNFKIGNGESQIEVANRMYEALYETLNNNLGKKIAIVSHGTAITFLFMKLGEYKDNIIYYKDNVVIDNNFVWNAPEVFKLVFENNELSSIENIRK